MPPAPWKKWPHVWVFIFSVNYAMKRPVSDDSLSASSRTFPQWPFLCVRDTSDIFAIPLAIYDATRPMKKTATPMSFHFFCELCYETASFWRFFGC
jgi:hypothetical protein